MRSSLGIVASSRVAAAGGAITESFNKADSSILGPDLTWVEIEGDLRVASNAVEVVSLLTASAAYADSALTSSNNYAQVEVVTEFPSGTGSHIWIALCRMPGTSAVTGYEARLTRSSGGTPTLALRKTEAGTGTVIGSTSNYTGGYPATLRIEASGDQVTASVTDGTTTATIGPTTDTSITSGLYAGIRAFHAAARSSADNFEAGAL